MKKEVKIPDIAENVETGVIAGILVSEGDKVSEDQSLVEIETDKATTDLPSPYEGVIEEIKISEGDEVKVNEVIMIIETEGDGESEEDAEDEGEEKESDSKKQEESEKEDKDEEQEDSKNERKEDERAKGEENGELKESKKEEKKKDKENNEKPDLSDIAASPAVRRLAREMEVDLIEVKGSGPGDRISAEDVKKHAEGDEGEPAASPAKEVKLPDFSKWGSTSTEEMSRIRSITAKNVTQSWQTIPHVTQHDEADMTNLEEFRNNYQAKAEKASGKLTVTAILLKIAAYALQKFPQFNASLDFKNEKIIYKHYFNIGIAVDTPQGLLVPVIQDVNKKSLIDLSVELTEVAKKARDKKISIDELQGGNFTISNL